MSEVILFGDSITAGWNNEEGISDALTKRVASQVPYVIRNAGIPGDTTIEGLKRIKAHVLAYQPKLVVLFFGANDCAIYRNISVEEYVHNIEEMVQQIGPQKVVLIGPPFVNQKTHPGKRPLETIEAFTTGLAKWTCDQKVSYVSLLAKMQAKEPESWLQSDGLHFSEIGYDYLAEIYSQEIKQKMRELK